MELPFPSQQAVVENSFKSGANTDGKVWKIAAIRRPIKSASTTGMSKLPDAPAIIPCKPLSPPISNGNTASASLPNHAHIKATLSFNSGPCNFSPEILGDPQYPTFKIVPSLPSGMYFLTSSEVTILTTCPLLNMFLKTIRLP